MKPQLLLSKRIGRFWIGVYNYLQWGYCVDRYEKAHTHDLDIGFILLTW